MPNIQLTERLYSEVERRARQAGFSSVDEFVAERRESDFLDVTENLDERFRPEILDHLDRISGDMKAGQSVSMDEVEQHLAEVRKSWQKKRAD